MTTNKIIVMKVHDEASLQQVWAIRRKVFVEEQNCPEDLEWENEEASTHFLARSGGAPAGACRWRKTSNGYKLERFAVLREFRGCGVGTELVKTALADLPPDALYIYLNAQINAVGLYSKFGFRSVGAEFEEAGIRHLKMELNR